MTVRRRLHAQLFGVALFVGEPRANAPEPLDLRWEAPAGCPGADEARARVTRFLGRAPGLAGDPRVHARVQISEREGLYVAELDLASDDGSGQRRFEAERCEVVADAAAYMVAAMIDPSVEPPELQSEPTPTRSPAPVASSPASRAEPRAAARPRPRARIGGGLRLAPAISAGPLPSIAAGLVGGAALLLPRLRIELLATHWFARPARVDARPEVGGDVRLTTGAVRVCPLVLLRPLEIPVCGGFEVGSMHGRGIGLTEPATTRLPWAAFTGGLGLVWMPSRFVGAFLDASLVVPVSRPVFVAEGVGKVFQPAPVAFAGMLGVEARFF